MESAFVRSTPRPSLASWFFACAMGATIVAVLTITVVADRFVRAEDRQQASQYLQAHADALRDALDRGMSQHFEEVHVIAQLDQVARSNDPQAVRRVLDQVRASFPMLAWLGVVDNDGKVIAATDGMLEGANVASRPWFTGSRNASFVGDVHGAVLLEKLLPARSEPWRFVDIATPVRGADGQIKAVFGAHLSWTWAAQIKHELVDRVIEQHQAESLVLAADGTVLLGPAALQGKKYDASAHPAYVTVDTATRGAGRYPGLGWKVVVRQPEAMAMAPYYGLRLRMQLAAAVLCLLLAPLLWLLARRLAAPMRELTAELEARAPTRVQRNPLYREAVLLGDALARHDQRHTEDADRLRELNATLEERIAQRTADLTGSEQRLRAIADNLPVLIAYFDANELCRFANANAMKIHRMKPERLQQTTLRDALGDRYETYERYIRRALSGKRTTFDGQSVIGGVNVDFQTHLVPDIAPDGSVAGLYILSHDHTALKAAERRSNAGEARLRTIADNLPVLISYIDQEERYQFCNRTYETWLGLDTQAIVGKTVQETLAPVDYAARKSHLARALAGERSELEMAVSGKNARHLHTTYLPDVAPDGTIGGIYVLAVDVTAMKEAEQQLKSTARTDTLTGLPNRLHFNEKLGEALARSRRRRTPIALLFLDVDRFKSINDSLGHASGDEVLKTFAKRLKSSVRETDTVARLAGDEFVVVLEDLHTPAEPQFVARKILTSIGRPFHLQNGVIDVSTSIGIAYQADGNVQPEQLLATADKSLYEAKAGGRNTFRVTSA